MKLTVNLAVMQDAPRAGMLVQVLRTADAHLVR